MKLDLLDLKASLCKGLERESVAPVICSLILDELEDQSTTETNDQQLRNATDDEFNQQLHSETIHADEQQLQSDTNNEDEKQLQSDGADARVQ